MSGRETAVNTAGWNMRYYTYSFSAAAEAATALLLATAIVLVFFA